MIKRKFFVWGMSFLFLCLATNSHADVTKESTNQMDFKGTLGAVLKFFGAGKPTTTAEYYKGDVYKSDTIDAKGKVTNSQIIDLDKELFITIDYQKKRYTQMTFDEWRKMMQENIQKMEAGQEKNKEKSPEVEWKFDMNVSKPGETETIAGKKAEKVIIKMDISAKATPQEQTEEQAQNAQGEMTVTSTYWMVNEMEGQKEIENFYKKLAEKLGFLPGQGGMEAIMSRINQTNPQLAEAIKKVQEEGKKLSGVPLRTHTVYETKKAAVETNKQEEEQKTEIPTSVGGLFKKFGKKVTKSNENTADQNVLMETNTEVTKFEVAPIDMNDFAVPANYKLQKN